MNSPELTYAVTTLANVIACGLTPDEIALAAGILVQLGDTLATIAAYQALMGDGADESQAGDEGQKNGGK